MVQVFSIFVAAAAVAVLAVSAEVSVRGVGRVPVETETVIIDYSVTRSNLQVSVAAQQVAAVAETVRKGLAQSALVMLEADLSSVDYSVTQEYDYSDPNKPVPRGFAVSQQFQLCVEKAESVGKVIDILTQEGNDVTISGVTFTPKVSEEAKDKALQLAVQDAKKQAKLMVSSAGHVLGKLSTISKYENPLSGRKYGDRTAAPADPSGTVLDRSGPVYEVSVVATWEVEEASAESW